MKIVVILFTMLSNPHGIIHKVEYQTSFVDCYAAEQASLNKAFTDYVNTGRASEVIIMECTQ